MELKALRYPFFSACALVFLQRNTSLIPVPLSVWWYTSMLSLLSCSTLTYSHDNIVFSISGFKYDYDYLLCFLRLCVSVCPYLDSTYVCCSNNRSGYSRPYIIMDLLFVLAYGPDPICPRLILFLTCVCHQLQRNEQLFSAAWSFKAFDVDTCPYMAYTTTICQL